MATEETELTFIRCPNCRSLVPAVATRCRMCGQLIEQGAEPVTSPGSDSLGKRPRVRQRTMSVSDSDVATAKEDVDTSPVGPEGGEDPLRFVSRESRSSEPTRSVIGEQEEKGVGTWPQEPRSAEVPEPSRVEPRPLERRRSPLFGPPQPVFPRRPETEQHSEPQPSLHRDVTPIPSSMSAGDQKGAAKVTLPEEEEPEPEFPGEHGDEQFDGDTEEHDEGLDDSVGTQSSVSQGEASEAEPRKRRRRRKRKKWGVRAGEKSPVEKSGASSEKSMPAQSRPEVRGEVKKMGSDRLISRGTNLKDEERENGVRSSTRDPVVSRPVREPAFPATGLEFASEQRQVLREGSPEGREEPTRPRGLSSETSAELEQDGVLVGWFVDYTKDPRGSAWEIRSGRFFLSGEQLRPTDVVLKNGSLSTPHCLVRASLRGGIQLQDLMSEKGTFLRRAGEQTFQRMNEPFTADNGDTVRFGDYELRICVIR